MNTTWTSLKEYQDEKAAEAVPAGDKLKHLTEGSEHLRTRSWTDEQISGIPADLVQFAYANSGALQAEFGDLATFQAYLRACKDGIVRR